MLLRPCPSSEEVDGLRRTERVRVTVGGGGKSSSVVSPSSAKLQSGQQRNGMVWVRDQLSYPLELPSDSPDVLGSGAP